MASGLTGLHGVLVVPPVEVGLRQEAAPVPAQRQTMEEQRALDQLLKIKTVPPKIAL